METSAVHVYALTSNVVSNGRHFRSVVDDDQMCLLVQIMTSRSCLWLSGILLHYLEACMTVVVECETTVGRTSSYANTQSVTWVVLICIYRAVVIARLALEMNGNVFFNPIPSHSQWFIPIPNPRFSLALFPFRWLFPFPPAPILVLLVVSHQITNDRWT